MMMMMMMMMLMMMTASEALVVYSKQKIAQIPLSSYLALQEFGLSGQAETLEACCSLPHHHPSHQPHRTMLLP
jgi:hypothetical protein